MRRITRETTFDELYELPELSPFSDYMVYTGDGELIRGITIEERSRRDNWNTEAVVGGLNFLSEQSEKGRVHFYPLYNEDTCDDPAKKDVSFIHIAPEEPDPKKPAIILCAGGGYVCVCNMVESFPTARYYVEAGYSVFVLTYRVTSLPVLPNALADLARGVRFLGENCQKLCVPADDYIICGWSAGANLVCNFGTTEVGYQAFQVPKPRSIFTVYTPVFLSDEAAKSFFGRQMLGELSDSEIEKYRLEKKVNKDFPPCYLVCGQDDAVVDPENSRVLDVLLTKAGVLHIFEEVAHAHHGCGDGLGTDAEGWPLRALAFAMDCSGDFPFEHQP